jgi:acetylornithine deacetylase/succinyl-diaminopimelate desuccinylase-like protein
VTGGVGHSGGAHAPDEFASLEGLRQHIVAAAEFLLAFADIGAPERAEVARA